MQRSARVALRTYPEFKERWERCAADVGFDLSSFVEHTLNERCAELDEPDDELPDFDPQPEGT